MAEASARIHAARTALKNARDRKKGILSTFRQAVRTSMDSSVDLLEFRQKEFALRASNVTKTMFTAYDEMTSRLEEALMNAMDAVGRNSPKKIDKMFDIEAAAALTARDRAEASLNDATSQCMAEMRALEASTRTLLDDVDEEIKNGIEEYYAAADDERVCYMEAQRATIACKMAHAAVKVYEEQYNATKNMSDEAHTWASSLDDEIAQLNKDYAIAEERHLEAAKVVDAALVEVEAAEKDVLSTSTPDDSNQTSARRQSVRNVFEVINRFSTMVRDKSARGDSDTFASLKQLSLQAGSDSPRNSDEQHRVSMLGFSTSFPDADATMESIMEKAHELEHSRDVQTLTRNVSRSAMAYNPLQK
jgi:peptidyl-tRNA hydrolase